MNQQAAQNYFRTRVLTATPEQLQLMLYDGAIRFGEQARPALLAKNYAQSFNLISRVQNIVAEMTGSLKREIAPSMCDKLIALYNFAYRKLIEANIHHRVEALDEAMRVLRYQRETWVMLMNKLTQQKAAETAMTLDIPAPDERMEAGISLRG